MRAVPSQLIVVTALVASVVFAPEAVSQDVASGSDDVARSPTSGFETFEDAFQFAENSFLYGDYLDVVQALWPWLLPEPATETDDEVLVRAYTLLGTAAHFERQGPIADDAFLEILRRAPDHRLDPLIYPPRVIERFEDVREANAEELDALRAPEDRAATLYVQQEVREQTLLVSMLPFGYGFFTSGRDAQGVGYLIGETLLGTTMIGLYAANEIARDENGFYEDPVRARNRGRAQVGVAAGFTTLVLINAIHGAVTHSDSRRVSYRTLTEPPPELRDDLGDSRRRGWRVSFTPLVSF